MSKKLVSLFMTIIIAISISVSASANFVDMGDISAAIPENEIPNTVDVTYEPINSPLRRFISNT